MSENDQFNAATEIAMSGNLMRQPGEPSVEEILDSIKKVIARDSNTVASPRALSNPNTAPRPDDVLELSEVAAQIMGDSVRSPRLNGAEAVRHTVDKVGSGQSTVADSVDALLPPDTTASMRESLAALAMMTHPGVQPQIVRSGETSLEGMVRDMLRPMLAQWLDTNLPALVDKLVASEIARITGKKA